MKKLFCLYSLLLLYSSLLPAGIPGNLLINSEFYPDSFQRIADWEIPYQMKYPGFAKLLPGAFQGQNAVRLDFTRHTVFRFDYLQLPDKDEKYRLGIHIRTRNFQAHSCGFIVFNQSWTATSGFDSLPDTEGRWQKLEKTITMPPGPLNRYSVAVYAHQASGEIDIAAPFLIPLTPKAIKESRVSRPWVKKNTRVVPMEPKLSELDCRTGKIRFYLSKASLDCPLQEVSCRILLKGNAEKEFTARGTYSFQPDGEFTAKLGRLNTSRGQLKTELRHRTTGELISSHIYSYRTRDYSRDQGSPLNNFVRKLKYQSLGKDLYQFYNPRDQWIAVQLENPADDLEIRVNAPGAPVFRKQPGYPFFAFQYLPEGEYNFTVKSAAAPKNLRVLSVAETYLCHFLISDTENPNAHGLDFVRKYQMPGANVFDLGTLVPDKYLQLFRAQGKLVISDFAIYHPVYGTWPEKCFADIQKHLKFSRADALTLDEIGEHWGFYSQFGVAEACWRYQDFHKPINIFYTSEGVARFTYPDTHRNLFAAGSNSAGGKGKIYLECYIIPQTSEEAARTYLTRDFHRSIRSIREQAGDGASRCIIVFSTVTQHGSWHMDSFPECDFKYFLDMACNLLANDPAFQGLGGIGDFHQHRPAGFEEHHRWLAALMKHYCIDGKKEMLSSHYGYKYISGHLEDGNFTRQFQKWQSQPAESNSLQAVTINGYGKYSGLWAARPDIGDTASLWVRSSHKANILKQKLKGLTPGKLYSLVYLCTDQAGSGTHQATAPMINAEIRNAEILPPQLDSLRKCPRNGGVLKNPSMLFTRKIIFRPRTPETEVIFSDWGEQAPLGKPGMKSYLNGISVHPYFAPETGR